MCKLNHRGEKEERNGRSWNRLPLHVPGDGTNVSVYWFKEYPTYVKEGLNRGKHLVNDWDGVKG